MRALRRRLVLLLFLVVAPVATVPAQPAAGGGLPVRAEPPRTLHGQSHVYIAYSIAWLLVFGYVLSLGRRFRRLEEELVRAGEGPPR